MKGLLARSSRRKIQLSLQVSNYIKFIRFGINRNRWKSKEGRSSFSVADPTMDAYHAREIIAEKNKVVLVIWWFNNFHMYIVIYCIQEYQWYYGNYVVGLWVMYVRTLLQQLYFCSVERHRKHHSLVCPNMIKFNKYSIRFQYIPTISIYLPWYPQYIYHFSCLNHAILPALSHHTPRYPDETTILPIKSAQVWPAT